MRDGAADFVTSNTIVGRPKLTPEIALHLATEVTPLWRATADTLSQAGAEPPFWAFAWPGGQALARYVLDHPESVAGRRVLDIASGSGLVAIAASKAGAASVTANDVDPLSISAALLNGSLNGVSLDTSCDDLTGLPVPREWDAVLAGDVFYDRDMAARLAPWLAARAAAGALVLIGDPGRIYLPAERLEALETYEIATSLDLESAEMLTGTVWRLTG